MIQKLNVRVKQSRHLIATLVMLISCSLVQASNISNEIAKLQASDPSAYARFGYDVAVEGDVMVVGADGDNSVGAAYVFRYDGNNWVQETKLVSNNPHPGDRFGAAVAIDNNTIAIGCPNSDDSGQYFGYAQVFVYDGSDWNLQATLSAQTPVFYDIFAASIAISNNHIVIGARGDANYRGAAYVYKRTSTTWTQTDKLSAPNGQANDLFGQAVAIDANKIIIGATGDNAYTGAAYVYANNGSSWSVEQKILSNNSPSDLFGTSVAISGTRIAVGDIFGSTNNGNVTVFDFDGANWNETAKLFADDAQTYNYFGSSLALNDTTLLVGAYGADSYNGAAYVFKWDGSAWAQNLKLVGSDSAQYDMLGYRVALGNGIYVAGAQGVNNSGNSSSGAAYVFNDDGGVAPPPPPPPTPDYTALATELQSLSDSCQSSNDLQEASKRGLSKWNGTINTLVNDVTNNNLTAVCSDLNTLLSHADGGKRPRDWVKGACVTQGHNPYLLDNINELIGLTCN